MNSTAGARQLEQPARLDLSLGEPGYDPPGEATAAAATAILHGRNGYLPPGGLPALRSALAHKLQNQNGIAAIAEQVVITTGASLGLFASLAVLCQPQDRVLIPDPGFPLYRLMAETLRLQPVRYSLRADAAREPDWSALGEVAPQARVLIWNFPSNPLGTVARPEWLPRLYDLVAAHPHLYLLSDEVYEDLVFNGAHVSPAAGAGAVAERIFSVFSFSKTYAMTGFRVGYVHAPPPWAARVEKAQWGASMSAPSIGQRAALAALHAPGTYHQQIMVLLRHNRALTLDRLQNWDLPCVEPEAGFFAWVNIQRSGLEAPTFSAACADQCGVLVSPGTHFSPTAGDHVRLSFAGSSKALLEGLDRIGRWVDSRERG